MRRASLRKIAFVVAWMVLAVAFPHARARQEPDLAGTCTGGIGSRQVSASASTRVQVVLGRHIGQRPAGKPAISLTHY